MKAKKIAVLYAGAAYWGGIETILEQIFVNVDKTKLDLTLVSIGQWELGDRLTTAGYKTKNFQKKWYQPGLVKELATYFVDEEYNLVTAQGLVANYFGRLSAKRANIPNLITIHSDYKFDYHGFKKLIFWLTFKVFESYTDKYVVVSKFLQRETIKLGVNEKKIDVIYNGVREIKVKAKKREETVVFGSLGRLHYKKGYQGLINAVNLIKDLDFKVYIWGSGDDKAELTSMIRRFGLLEKVFLKGFTNDVASSLTETDIYVQPSLEEGFGITVVEGMYAGRPVIVTPAGSLPELITDGKTGLITDGFSPEAIATAMKVLIENQELSDRLAKAGQEEALNRFGIDKWIAEIEKTYLEAAK